MTPPVAPAPVETKTAGSSGVTVFVVLALWAVFTFVPGAKEALPADLQGLVPGIGAWLLATFAGYELPHTPRPDLAGVKDAALRRLEAAAAEQEQQVAVNAPAPRARRAKAAEVQEEAPPA